MALSPDGKTLVTNNSKYSTNGTIFDPMTRKFVFQLFCLRVWDVASGRLLHTFERGYRDDGLCFSSDGRVLAAANRKDQDSQDAPFIVLYDTRTWKTYRRLQGVEAVGIIDSVVISPNGRWLASSVAVGEGGISALYIWDIHSGRRIRYFSPNRQNDSNNGNVLERSLLESLCYPIFLHDNKSLILGNVIYRFAPPSKIRPLLRGVSRKDWNTDAVYSDRITQIAFTRDGSRTGVLEVWRLNPQKLLFKTRYKENEHLGYVHFSPDGRTIAMADGKQLKIWRIP